MRWLLFLMAFAMWASTPCTIQDSTSCPSAGQIAGTLPAETWAGPPAFQTFLTGSYQSFQALQADYASAPQPVTLPCAQVVPMVASYIQSDPTTCPGSGTCNYDSLVVIENYIRSLVDTKIGLGLSCLDFNLWIDPFFASAAYKSGAGNLNYCGSYGACYDTSAMAVNTLPVFTSVFSWLHMTYPNVKVYVAPVIDGLSTTVCGITRGYTCASGSGSTCKNPKYNYTELQIQKCLAPAFAALAHSVYIDGFSIVHEPTGVDPLEMGIDQYGPDGGAWLSPSDNTALIAYIAPIVRRVSLNPNIKLGSGFLLGDDAGDTPVHSCASPGVNSFFCNELANLYACSGDKNILDYVSVHTYPNESGSAARYYTAKAVSNTGLLNSFTTMLANVPGCKDKVADEGGFQTGRWGSSTATGDGGAWLNMPFKEFLDDGSFAAWTNAYFAWARGNNLQRSSLYSCSEALLMISTDPNNMRCSHGVNSTGLGSSTDHYDVNLMQALKAQGSTGALTSAYGKIYAAAGTPPLVSGQENPQSTGP